MKKCKGCGIFLQNSNDKLDGYTTNIDNDLCERCFRIKNYNEYKIVEKDNKQFIDILKEINKTNDLVVLLVDLFNIPINLNEITKYLNNEILLVLTKKDIFSYKISDQKFLSYNYGINYIDSLVVSSNKNYNFDLLYEKINKYKKSNNVYIIGYTNSGKSTLINKFVHNYSKNNINITTSNLPSTTLNTIEITINDTLTLIDTPGILENNNIDINLLKKINSKKEIKPITYQIHNKQYIYIEDIIKIETSNNNLTFYFSNNLKIERKYNDNKKLVNKKIINVKANEDIVISGLGFIKATNSERIKISTKTNYLIYTRQSLI